MSDIDWTALRRLIETPLYKAEKGDYAELVDENDEQGMVGIYRKSGTPVLFMPRDVWDRLREEVGE